VVKNKTGFNKQNLKPDL